MLSLELLRREPDRVRHALSRRGEQEAVEQVLALDERRRAVVLQNDELRRQRNEASKAIGQAMRGTADAGQEAVEAQREEMRQVGERLKALDEQVRTLDEQLRGLMLTLPNLPLDDVPDGEDGSANVIVRQEGTPRAFDFTPLPHWDLAERLGVIDFQRGAKLSGARFYVLVDAGIRLQRALVSWMLDLHRTQHGYQEMGLPYLVRQEVMEGSGNLPRFAENLYHDAEDDLWLIPTAEVPLTNLHRDEILDPGTLPIKYVAHTPCFRREKTAAGRDVRGIKRVHQFDKVELYQFVEPEQSGDALEALLGHAEAVCRGLDIPYRVVRLATGDLGFPSANSYDLEMWSPGSKEWLEVSSCSNCTDFQARRANVRFRRQPGAKPEHVHTLNGSGLALPRVLIAVLENYQQADGAVRVPTVLQPYLGLERLEPAGP